MDIPKQITTMVEGKTVEQVLQLAADAADQGQEILAEELEAYAAEMLIVEANS